MIWADRVGLVLSLPVILMALVQSPGGVPPWELVAVLVAAIWIALRGADFVVSGKIRH